MPAFEQNRANRAEVVFKPALIHIRDFSCSTPNIHTELLTPRFHRQNRCAPSLLRSDTDTFLAPSGSKCGTAIRLGRFCPLAHGDDDDFIPLSSIAAPHGPHVRTPPQTVQCLTRHVAAASKQETRARPAKSSASPRRRSGDFILDLRFSTSGCPTARAA